MTKINFKNSYTLKRTKGEDITLAGMEINEEKELQFFYDTEGYNWYPKTDWNTNNSIAYAMQDSTKDYAIQIVNPQELVANELNKEVKRLAKNARAKARRLKKKEGLK